MTTSSGPHEADAVVVTLPIGVMASGVVDFAPELSDRKHDAMTRIGMGLLDKTVLVFDEVSWPTDAHVFGFVSNDLGQWGSWLNLAAVTGDPALIGFNSGSVARRLASMPEDDVVASAMRTIDTMFG